MKVYLLILLVAAAVTFLATPVVRQLSFRIGALSPVRERDVHSVPTPRLGGLAMLLGVFVALFLARLTPFLKGQLQSPELTAVLVGAILTCLLGAADDLWDLSWELKIGGQILIALVTAYLGVTVYSFPLVDLTIGSSQLSMTVSVLVIVLLMNAVNFVDGLDGLAAGMMGIGVSGFFIYSYVLTRLTGAPSYASLATAISAAIIGVCLGFLPHNFHPARIFMGDSGALLLGFLTGCTIIIVTGQIDPNSVATERVAPVWLPVILPFAIVILPLTDMIMAVVRRTRSGHSPFKADRMHLHHRLLQAGHSVPRAVLVMYLWTAIVSLGLSAVLVIPLRFILPTVAGLVVVGILTTWTVMPDISHNEDVADPPAPAEEQKGSSHAPQP